MPRAFAALTFTPAVLAAQQRYTRNRHPPVLSDAAPEPDRLGESEMAFIAERDSFYQSTVTEAGWPYVQHRGGPTGFLKVLDDSTIAFPDFRGNLQYLSVGNLAANDRICLILMDYSKRRRLKIWGHARVVHASEDPALLERLDMPGHRGVVERALVITVTALDWNCPQHITQRYTLDEVGRMTAHLRAEIASLQAALRERA